MRYGYARVSTKEQDETRQVEALRNKGVQEIVIEKASGKNFIDRTEWQKLMAKIVVDELLSKKQVYLEFLDNEILNTKKPTTEAEKLTQELLQPIVLHLLGYFAERERKLIKERQKEAYQQLETDAKGRKLSNKKTDKRGNKKVCGRPNAIENLTKEQKSAIKSWIKKDIKTNQCIQLTGLGRTTIFKIKKEMVSN